MTATTHVRALSSEGAGTEAFIDQFCRAPAALRPPSHQVGLLPAPVTRGLLDMRRLCEAEFWLADGPGGTIAGRAGAAISKHHPGMASFGFFECDGTLRTSRALVDAARTWAKARGAKRLVGPLIYNTWFPYRFRINATDETFFSWEPVNLASYVAAFAENGFKLLETYHSMGLAGVPAMLEGTREAHANALAQGYSFREFKADGFLENEVPRLHAISMEAFKDNLLFEPIPLEIFRSLYLPMAKELVPPLTCFALDPKGREVGFFFFFPDGEYLVMKSVGVLPEERGRGLSNAIVHQILSTEAARKFEKAITALVRSGARSESYAKKATELWKHEYALFEAPLP